MTEKYIVYHKYGIRPDDENGGYFESYRTYTKDNYTEFPMKAKHYTSLRNALKHRVGFDKKNISYAKEVKIKIDKQFSRIKKLNRVTDLDDNDGISLDNIKLFTNDSGEEVTKVYKLIIDGDRIETISTNNEVYNYVLEILRKKKIEDEKLHKFTFENTNTDNIINDADDEFWN